jgi:hypothetical protein
MTITSRARTAGHRATDSTALEGVARVGFVARGAIYVLIGVIAVQIAVGRGGQADRGGALTQIAAHTYGVVALWLLVIGFGGLALWRISEVAFGAHVPDGRHAGERLKSLGSAALYLVFFVSTLKLVTGVSSSATANGNSQPQALTARIMTHAGGRLLVGAAGVVILAVGVLLARASWKKEFLERMNLSAAPARTRALVEKLGVVGGVARGAMTALAGVLLTVAAVRFAPAQAQGVDGTLRAFAHTPVGPFLLILVALGLVAFGLFSWCEARWRLV